MGGTHETYEQYWVHYSNRPFSEFSYWFELEFENPMQNSFGKIYLPRVWVWNAENSVFGSHNQKGRYPCNDGSKKSVIHPRRAYSKNININIVFLGLSTYYKKFIRGFLQLASTFTKLTKQRLSLGPQKHKHPLKNLMCIGPILAITDFTLPFVLEWDASRDGLLTILNATRVTYII